MNFLLLEFLFASVRVIRGPVVFGIHHSDFVIYFHEFVSIRVD